MHGIKPDDLRLIHSITSLILPGFLALGSVHAQFEPVSCNGLPYNPDADCDGVIGTFDFLPFAALFGLEFTADFDSLTLPDYMDPDPTNELQWLAIDGDTLHLLLADSTIYSSVFIGGADGADGADGVDGMDGADGADGLSAYDLWLAAGNTESVEDFLASLVGQDGADGVNGADGADGADGANGADGLSAYEVWLAHGNEGTEDDFFASLTGPEGPQGPAGQNGLDGANGSDGTNGTDGADGADGLSAYEIWLAAGNTGNETDFLASLVGQDGANGVNGADGADGANGADGMNGLDGLNGADGADGLSAFEIWLAAGNNGNETDFLASLVGQDGADGVNGADGADGANGADGLSAYEVWLAHGNEGTEDDFFASLTGPEGPQGPAGQNGLDGANGIDGTNGTDGADGADGLSAYEIWLAAGNNGNEADFLASLVGAPGEDGEDGVQGPQGSEGPQGPEGEAGADGADGAAGLSAYEIWLGLGNTGTEEDFIAYLSGGAAFSPSVHGVFDSQTDGNTFEIAEAIATVSIELWGASGGSGGDICGQTLGASSCNLCDATGGAGGRALKVVTMVYNLAQGDVLTLVPAAAGADSGELITCNPGLTGWTDWDCGPASSGEDAGTTQLLLNGEVIAEISGGMGGTGACIGCQGDGCFNGDPGAEGALSSSANWMTILNTQTLEDNTGSRIILRY